MGFELLTTGGASPRAETTSSTPAALLAKAVAMGADIHTENNQKMLNGKPLWLCAKSDDYHGGQGIVVYTGKWTRQQLEELRAKCGDGVSVLDGGAFLNAVRSGEWPA